MENNFETVQDTSKLQRYKPLVIILGSVLVSSLALSFVDGRIHGFMSSFMGLFLVNFAMFKLFDLQGFVKGFSMYDIIAQYFPKYALAYPFIELVLGLLYLSSFAPVITSILVLAIMSVGAVGVFKAVITGDKKLKCACLGTTLNVPLSTVSIIENVGMALMALYMIAS